jgi:hypothetical protein
MKNVLILYFVICFCSITIFISCNDEVNSNQNVTPNIIQPTVDNACQQVFSLNNETVPIAIREIGNYHNLILGHFTRLTFVKEKCALSEYTLLQSRFDSVINSNIVYSQFFENVQTLGIANFYLNVLEICDFTEKSPVELLKHFIDKTDILLVGKVSEFERSFIKSFFYDILEDNAKPLIDYVKEIELNRTQFLQNGSFSLALLSIYDNSFCFWNNKYSNYRVCPPCAVAAAWDVAGAFYEGGKDIYNNGGAPTDNFLRKMGRGALSASIPLAGGDIASWLGW